MVKVQSATEDTLLGEPQTVRGAAWKISAEEVSRQEQTSRLRTSLPATFSPYILFPDDPPVHYWNIFMVLLLLYTVLVTPYRVAFIDVDSLSWVIVDTVIDGLFFFDMILNSLQAYYDEEKNVVTSHMRILMRYVKSWMLPDFLSCIPLQLIFSEQLSYNNLLRLSRLPRIYKLVRMFRLTRMMKVVKNRATIMRYMTQVLRISLSMERLFWFCVTLLFILHLITCTWVFVGRYNQDIDSQNWIFVFNFSDFDNLNLYIVAMYWTITTVATVGYGDIRSINVYEMCTNCVIMLIGVFIYSYMIGSLTNLLSSLDIRKAKLNQKMELLIELSKEYEFNKNFYTKLTNALEYEHKNTNRELDDLINSLPNNLRTQLLVIIYQKKIVNNGFFEGRSQHFVAWVAPLLKPARFMEDEFVYREGDFASEMYFLVRGVVDFVLDKKTEFLSYLSVQQDYFFGELDLLFSDSKLRMHTTRSQSKSELLCFKEDHLEQLLKTFENESLEIMALAEERQSRLDERRMTAEAEYNVKNRVVRHDTMPPKPDEKKITMLDFKQDLEAKAEPSSDEEDIDQTPYQASQIISMFPVAQDDKEGCSPKIVLEPPVRRNRPKRNSIVPKPIFAKIKEKAMKKRQYTGLNDVSKQVKELGGTIENMRGLVIQLCFKFNLSQALLPPKPKPLPPKTRGKRRRSSWQIPQGEKIEESSEDNEDSA